MLQQRHRFLPSRLIFVALLVLVVALIGLFFDKTKTVAQTDDKICNVILIVDRSGSIGRQMDFYKSQIQILFEGPPSPNERALGIYDANIKIGFWSFSHSNDTSSNLYNSPRSSYSSSTEASTSFTDALYRLEPLNGTDYVQAFGYKGFTADSMVFNSSLDADAKIADLIVLITDGGPNFPVNATNNTRLVTDPNDNRYAISMAKQALIKLSERYRGINAAAGAFIFGQDLDVNNSGLSNLTDVIIGSWPGPKKYVFTANGIGELAAKLKSEIGLICPDIIGPSVDLIPDVKKAADDEFVYGDTQKPFTYTVENRGVRPSEKADWSIWRSIDGGREVKKTFELEKQFPSGNSELMSGGVPFTIDELPDYRRRVTICDRLEIIMRVNTPNQEVANDRECITFGGLMPTMQVRGGDFYVGRHFATDQTKKTTSSIDGRVAMTLGDQRFRSWAEYGVFATGDVKSFASGAAFRSGSEDEAHPLTFANADNTYGKFIDILQPNLWTIPNVVGTLLSGTYDDISLSASQPQLDLKDVNSSTSAKYVSNSTSLTINNSKTNKQLNEGAKILIYAPNTDVTINDHIKLSNTYLNIDSLPQLVIVAKNINIKPNVSEVNAWLIAQGSESDGGKINTCKFDTSASECETNPLRINGPIIARTLQAHRKYTQYDRTAQKLEPAEVFNLPATAYLYLLNKKTADNNNNPLFETSWSVELPPYF